VLTEWRTVLRRLFPATVAALLAFLSPTSVQGFFPTDFHTVGGALGTSHQDIVVQALASVTLEDCGPLGINLEDAVAGAIQVAAANAAVDENQFNSEYHCDGESFPEVQDRLSTLRNSILSSLTSNDAASARSSLGQALHTIQDFYSHSNWVELGNSLPHSTLGRSGPIFRLASTTATCKDCDFTLSCNLSNCTGNRNIITSQLTSGYYKDENRVYPSGTYKCRHGGPFDECPGFAGLSCGINKDSSSCLFSEHNDYNGQAVSLAIAATKQFIRDIGSISPAKYHLLLGCRSNLSMSVDTTGSMGAMQAAIKSQISDTVDDWSAGGRLPVKFTLAPFNDPVVPAPTITTDAATFKSAVNALGASGGGDCPELAFTGVLNGLWAADGPGSLFLFTDASAKDPQFMPVALALALLKHVKVWIFLPTAMPCGNQFVDLSYYLLAENSGGGLIYPAPN